MTYWEDKWCALKEWFQFIPTWLKAVLLTLLVLVGGGGVIVLTSVILYETGCLTFYILFSKNQCLPTDVFRDMIVTGMMGFASIGIFLICCLILGFAMFGVYVLFRCSQRWIDE